MLLRLDPAEHRRVEPLIPPDDPLTAGLHYSLFNRSAEPGLPGVDCFVDDAAEPTLVLTRDWGLMFHSPEPGSFQAALDYLLSRTYLKQLEDELPSDIDEEVARHYREVLHFSALESDWCRMLAERLPIERENRCLVYYWDSPPPREPRLPLIDLGPEHAELVESFWPYGDGGEGSIGYIRWCLKSGPAPAWLDENGEPGAWCMTHGNGSMGNIHVLERYRRRGIAGELTNAMIRATLAEGRLPFCHIVETNEASIRMSEKSGLKYAGRVSWITARRP